MKPRAINSRRSLLDLARDDLRLPLPPLRRVQPERDDRFLAESGKVLASSLDYERTLEQVARVAVPAYADWCVVDVVEADASLSRVVVAHADPAHAELAEGLRQKLDGIAAELGDVHTAVLLADLTEESFVRVARGGKSLPGMAGLEALASVGIRSCMIVPMVARGTRLGAITFATTRTNYAHENLHCAEELAERAALAIDNARLYREAQAAIQARDEFVQIASHELKTPMTSLQLRVEMLTRLLARPETTREAMTAQLSSISRQVSRLEQITNELLDVARVTAGRLQIEVEPLDLSALAREVVERFEPDLKRKGVRLDLAAPPALNGRFDRVRCDQVLTNLISNAIKYGGGKPIDVALSATDERVELLVRDRGIGISEKNLARIFGRFERAVSQRKIGGVGLGLWITRSAIEAMSGSISVESEPGEGSVFRVYIPRHGEPTAHLIH